MIVKLVQPGNSYGDRLAFSARSTIRVRFFSNCSSFSVSPEPSESMSKSAGCEKGDDESHAHLVQFLREWAHRRHWAFNRVVSDLPSLVPSPHTE